MRIYYNFMFSSFYLAKSNGHFDARFYTSSLSLTIITLMGLNVFSIVRMFIDLPNSYALFVMPLVVVVGKLNDNFLNKNFDDIVKLYGHLKDKKMRNRLVVGLYFFITLLIFMLITGISIGVNPLP